MRRRSHLSCFYYCSELYQHDDDVGVGVVPELPEPPLHVLVSEVFGDVIDEESPHSPPVVGGGDGAVSLLPRRVPDLGLDGLPVNLKTEDGSFGLLLCMYCSQYTGRTKY